MKKFAMLMLCLVLVLLLQPVLEQIPRRRDRSRIPSR